MTDKERIAELEELCAEAYVVVWSMAIDLGRWDDEDVAKVLDNLAEQKFVHKDLPPFEATKGNPQMPVVGRDDKDNPTVLMRDALVLVRDLDMQINKWEGRYQEQCHWNGHLLGALMQCQRLFKDALPKFNWGASFLDANAIQLLNDTPARVDKVLASRPVEVPDAAD